MELEQLYLSHNGVTRIEGLEHNVNVHPNYFFACVFSCSPQVKLSTLDIGANDVPAIENLSHLTCLEELWVSYL